MVVGKHKCQEKEQEGQGLGSLERAPGHDETFTHLPGSILESLQQPWAPPALAPLLDDCYPLCSCYLLSSQIWDIVDFIFSPLCACIFYLSIISPYNCEPLQVPRAFSESCLQQSSPGGLEPSEPHAWNHLSPMLEMASQDGRQAGSLEGINPRSSQRLFQWTLQQNGGRGKGKRIQQSSIFLLSRGSYSRLSPRSFQTCGVSLVSKDTPRRSVCSQGAS